MAIPWWAMPQPKKITGMALANLLLKDVYVSALKEQLDREPVFYNPKLVAKKNLEYMERP